MHENTRSEALSSSHEVRSASQAESHDAAAQPPGHGVSLDTGAPPSNTAPANYQEGKPDQLLILRNGIDSVYLSFPGHLSFQKHIELEKLKKLAKSDHREEQALAIYPYGEYQFKVLRHGKGNFPYVLKNNCYHIQLAGHAAKQLPLAYVQITSEWLIQKGINAAVEELKAIIDPFRRRNPQGELEPVGEPTISRVDLFVDFTFSINLERLERRHWVGRSRDIATFSKGGEFTGWAIGLGGRIVCRLYDKTLEIIRSGKEYLKPLWHQAGWQPPAPVYRLEYQLRREVLGQFSLNTLQDLLQSLSSLWAHLTREWLRLTLPNAEDSNQSRWPTHSLWEGLQAVIWEGGNKPLDIRATPIQAPHDRYFARHHLSLLAGFMAREGLEHSAEGVRQLHHCAKDYCDGLSFVEGVDFERLLQEKIALKRRDYGIAHLETRRIRDQAILEVQAEAYRKESDGE